MYKNAAPIIDYNLYMKETAASNRRRLDNHIIDGFVLKQQNIRGTTTTVNDLVVGSTYDFYLTARN